MKEIWSSVSVALTASLLVGCSGVFRPSFDAASQGLAYQQKDIHTPGLSLTFFGTSTVLESDRRNAIMTDGFLTRPSWLRLAFGKLESSAEELDFALGPAKVKQVDGIFVAHSHHDPAMDSGPVAQKTGATVHGSESTLNIARGQKTPERQQRLLDGQPVLIGDSRSPLTKRRIRRSPSMSASSTTRFMLQRSCRTTSWGKAILSL